MKEEGRRKGLKKLTSKKEEGKLLRQPPFVPQARDYGESRGFGGPGEERTKRESALVKAEALASENLIPLGGLSGESIGLAKARRRWRPGG
jgi:hypothetical protein